MQYIASGIVWTRPRLHYDNHIIMGLGLMLALGTGLTSWALNYPFLTSTYVYVRLPLIGKFEIASAMAFDLGVFLVVVGSVMLMLVKLGSINSEDARNGSVSAHMNEILENQTLDDNFFEKEAIDGMADIGMFRGHDRLRSLSGAAGTDLSRDSGFNPDGICR